VTQSRPDDLPSIESLIARCDAIKNRLTLPRDDIARLNTLVQELAAILREALGEVESMQKYDLAERIYSILDRVPAD
jgi:hypothetical protein